MTLINYDKLGPYARFLEVVSLEGTLPAAGNRNMQKKKPGQVSMRKVVAN